MTRANANALFQGLKSQPSFSQAIRVQAGSPEDKMLAEARKEIRGAIREAFKQFRSYIDDKALLVEKRNDRAVSEGRRITSINVKFLTQGSYAYETLIRPAQRGQEIDLDDGVYFPIPFVDGQPVFPSEALFQAIEKALAPLVKARGWTFERKDTCVRVRLTGKNAHIDLPLYAVQAEKFNAITEKYALDHASMLPTLHRLGKAYSLPEKEILLAHRGEDWIHSDPKAIHDWFEQCCEHYGPVLKRLSCYTKAWRDNQWMDCEISSLALMVACVTALVRLNGRPADNRDDLMMLKVAETLPEAFQEGINNPVSGAALTDKWTDQERKLFTAKAYAMSEDLYAALHGTFHPDMVITRLQNVFGERLPDVPQAVSIAEARQTDVVVKMRPATVAAPLIKSSVSA